MKSTWLWYPGTLISYIYHHFAENLLWYNSTWWQSLGCFGFRWRHSMIGKVQNISIVMFFISFDARITQVWWADLLGNKSIYFECCSHNHFEPRMKLNTTAVIISETRLTPFIFHTVPYKNYTLHSSKSSRTDATTHNCQFLDGNTGCVCPRNKCITASRFLLRAP